jgi:hypothetical protein
MAAAAAAAAISQTELQASMLEKKGLVHGGGSGTMEKGAGSPMRAVEAAALRQV